MDDKLSGRAVAQGLMRALAQTFEPDILCTCHAYPAAIPTSTGHVLGCAVDQATREDLARMGIV